MTKKKNIKMDHFNNDLRFRTRHNITYWKIPKGSSMDLGMGDEAVESINFTRKKQIIKFKRSK